MNFQRQGVFSILWHDLSHSILCVNFVIVDKSDGTLLNKLLHEEIRIADFLKVDWILHLFLLVYKGCRDDFFPVHRWRRRLWNASISDSMFLVLLRDETISLRTKYWKDKFQSLSTTISLQCIDPHNRTKKNSLSSLKIKLISRSILM